MKKISAQVAGRTLGYALIYAPTRDGRNAVARDINAAKGIEEILAGLAFLYIKSLIRLCGASATALSPRISFQEAAEEQETSMMVLLPSGETPKSLKQDVSTTIPFFAHLTYLRAQLMDRDRHRCVLTAKVHTPSVNAQHPAVADITPDTQEAQLEVAHIISQSLTEGVTGLTEAARSKLVWAATTAAVLDRFAGTAVSDLLKNYDLHSPFNTFLATHDQYTEFDGLILWLEPVVVSFLFSIISNYITADCFV
ncbi:hypothetical protein C8F01DRAFT_978298 [Mycena amicta]|nr:hypothetical protein C8F01DRAFT_978298 [Mycena amicta]